MGVLKQKSKMKVIIVFTLFLLSFNFGFGVDPIVREDDYATDREDSLASNDQDVNLLDKYDQDQQILRDVNQENEDMDRKKKGKKGGRKILRLPNGKKTLQREEREARQRRDVNQENEDMDRKKKGKKGGRKILRLPNGKKTLQR